MYSIGLSTLFRMGCVCSKENLTIKGTKYQVLENIAQG